MTKIINNNEYIEILTDDFKLKDKIAGFDLDNTLIKTKSGRTFPIDENDWIFNYKTIIDILNNYNKIGYSIIIITNQKGLTTETKLDLWCNKIKEIIKNINLPVKVYVSIKDDIYRKPNLGIWELININNKIESFYCGDAMGRKQDHSDTDLKFALNANIPFKTPEEIFLHKNIIVPTIQNYPDFNCKKNKISFNENKDLIIMVGYPGSGKSMFSDKYLKNYEIVSQDELKTLPKCLKLCKEYMEKNYKIVIDNTNPSRETREKYIVLAKKYGYKVRCLLMTTTIQHAKHNNIYRYIYQNKLKVPTLVYNIYKNKFQEPELEEGYYEILKINPEVPSKLTNSKYYLYLF
jgi:bifunctional polynucleotide phosphatase/kinase